MYKKAIFILILVFCLTGFSGCGPSREEIQSDFTLLVAAEATPEHIRQTAAFLDENISKMGKDGAGHMLVSYEEYLLRYIDENPDEADVLGPFVEEDGSIDGEKITDAGARDLFENLKAGSVAVLIFEDAPVMRVDYPSLLEKYEKYLPESLRLLYELDADAFIVPMSENATLNVSWEEILNRAYRAEKILREFPGDHLVQENAEWLFSKYLTTLLMGTTNTPVFDYETEVFSSDAKAAYTRFIRENPDAVLSDALTEYFTYLESIDYQLDYNDITMSKVFFDTCDWISSESIKKLEELK